MGGAESILRGYNAQVAQILPEISTSDNLEWLSSHLRAECGIRENFDTNEYPNIFESKNLHKQICEYIRLKKFEQMPE